MELVKDRHSPDADDRNQGVDIFCLNLFQQFVRNVGFFVPGGHVKRVYDRRLAKDSSGGRIEVFNQFGAESNQTSIGITIRVQ